MEEDSHLVYKHPFDGAPNKPTSCFMKYKNGLFVGLGSILVLGVVIGLIVGLTIKSKPSAEALVDAITVENIMEHLRQFQKIAYLPKNKGSRGVLEGYMDSLNYVKNVLAKDTGCILSTDTFSVPVYYEYSAPQMSFVSSLNSATLQSGVDFIGMRYGGSGVYNISAPVKKASNFGCSLADFAGFLAGDIALIYYGPSGSTEDCTPLVKATNAVNAGASAVLIANDLSRKSLLASRVRAAGYFPGDTLIEIPVLTVTHSVGNSLSTLPDLILNVQTNTSIIVTETKNLYCTTPGGDPNNLVVIGAHLDSVPAGPGINDNGSGSATLLEIVRQFFRLKMKPVNKVQFSWWGAEEIGLLGSRFFVNNTKQHKPDLFNKIKLGINFDMLASPNGMSQVHSIHIGNPSFPASAYNGSDAITAVFSKHFEMIGAPMNLYGMTGGSDYLPFVEAGIPAGGLATGAGSLKTMEQRTKFGGLANAPYDPCYHLPCDTIENISKDILKKMSGAAAYGIGTFALQKNLDAFLAKAGK